METKSQQRYCNRPEQEGMQQNPRDMLSQAARLIELEESWHLEDPGIFGVKQSETRPAARAWTTSRSRLRSLTFLLPWANLMVLILLGTTHHHTISRSRAYSCIRPHPKPGRLHERMLCIGASFSVAPRVHHALLSASHPSPSTNGSSHALSASLTTRQRPAAVKIALTTAGASE